jgi:outer membrane protein TolC
MMGQYNSFYRHDNNLSVSQTIPFPSVFTARNALAEAQVKGAELKSAYTKQELFFRIKESYYTLRYLFELRTLLGSMDSVYLHLSTVAALNYKTGEGTLLASASSDLRQKDLENRIRQLNTEIQLQNEKLQTLVGVSYAVTADTSQPAERAFVPVYDSSLLSENKQLAWLRQQVIIMEKEKTLAANSSLPEIKLGYFNQTLFGVPLNEANQAFAGPNNRFQGFQVGLAIPVWFVPEMNRNKANRKQVEVSAMQYDNERFKLQSIYRQAYQDHARARQNLEFYKSVALPNAELILDQALKAFEGGETSYAEHLISIQQTASIRERYLNALNDYNQSAIYLEYITSQNTIK